MNKAVDLLKHGDIENAVEALLSFHNKESKVASAAANNLAIINIMVKKNYMLTKINIFLERPGFYGGISSIL